tara:strand:- start:1119 stop:1955 length:837 start_codon:yes stop_codon:yes gene_type:complete
MPKKAPKRKPPKPPQGPPPPTEEGEPAAAEALSEKAAGYGVSEVGKLLAKLEESIEELNEENDQTHSILRALEERDGEIQADFQKKYDELNNVIKHVKREQELVSNMVIGQNTKIRDIRDAIQGESDDDDGANAGQMAPKKSKKRTRTPKRERRTRTPVKAPAEPGSSGSEMSLGKPPRGVGRISKMEPQLEKQIKAIEELYAEYGEKKRGSREHCEKIVRKRVRSDGSEYKSFRAMDDISFEELKEMIRDNCEERAKTRRRKKPKRIKKKKGKSKKR